jgi:hypothetical protein
MNKKGHWILGALLSLFFILVTGALNLNWFYFDIKSVFILVGIVIFYSILPDLDHKNSTITWWFFGVGILGLCIGIIQLLFSLGNPASILIMSTIFVVITYVSAKVVPHRGFVHTVQAGILSTIPLWFLFHNFAYCLLAYVAWHSHLMGDGYIWKIK